MNIMIGIEDFTTEEDIDKLVSAGATEFFCGIIPREWSEKYGYQVSLNRREWSPNQFHSFEKLAVITKRVRHFQKKVAVAFNAPDYYSGQVVFLKKYFEILKEIGINALIVSETVLLLLLREMDLGFDIYISGTAGCYNRCAVEFYKKLGAKRIIFPRDTTLNEMEKIITQTRSFGMEYEAFIMGERCPFTESYCRTTHGFADTLFCHHLWQKNIFHRLPFDFYETCGAGGLRSSGDCIQQPSVKELGDWHHNAGRYSGWSSSGFSQIMNTSDFMIEECGMCAIPTLKKIGITSLKIVGRSRPVKIKIKRVELVHKVLQYSGKTSEYCRGIKKNKQLCSLGYKCYYPEARNF